MADWGSIDRGNTSPMWAGTRLGLSPNTANRDNLYQNVTANAFGTSSVNNTYGVFGVDSTEVRVQAATTKKGPAHTGWIFRTKGTGGRAGRISQEVLVAGGITTSNTGDDALYPDS